MSSPSALRRIRRPLPPYANVLGDATEIYCALGWKLGAAWRRIVIPPGRSASEYDLRCLRNRCVTVLHPAGHPQDRINEAVAAIRRAGAASVRAVPPVRRA